MKAKCFLIVLLGSLILSCASQPKQVALQDQLTAANARAGQLEDQIAGLKQDIAAKSAQIDSLTSKLATEQQTNSTLSQNLDALKSGATKNDAEYLSQIAALNKDKSALQDQLTSLQKEQAAVDAQIRQGELDLNDRIARLENLFAAEIQSGDMEIRRYKDILIVSVMESVFFVPDWPTMLPGGQDLLKKLAPAFKETPERIVRVEGNTAVAVSSPESLKYYPTSWHLGAARAAAVVSYLQNSCGMDPRQLVATSFGEYKPVASNATEQGKRENRRVDFILVSRDLWDISKLEPIDNFN